MQNQQETEPKAEPSYVKLHVKSSAVTYHAVDNQGGFSDTKENPIQFMSLEQLQSKFQTNILIDGEIRNSEGLSDEEAKIRLLRNGPNLLSPPKEKSKLRKYIVDDLGHPLIILLIISGALSFLAFGLHPADTGNMYTGIALVGAGLLSSIFSFIQEGQASNVMKSFLHMLPRYANVIRHRRLMRISAHELVVGDVVQVKGGDQIPADIRIIWLNECRIEVSSLTGESGPVTCTLTTDSSILEESRNILPNTARCIEGEAWGIVFAVGDDTMIGKIAKLASRTTIQPRTPIQQEIYLFVRNLTIFAVVFGLIFFAIGMGRGRSVIYSFINSFILVLIAAVPQSLPLLVISSLAITARRLAKKHVFIKELRSVETLGSTTVIASDKTGTLTQNKMVLSRVWLGGFSFSEEMLREVPRTDHNHPVNLIQLISGICNRARYEDEIKYTPEQASEIEIQETLILNPGLDLRVAKEKHPLYLEKIDVQSSLKEEFQKHKIGQVESKRDTARLVLGEPTEIALFQFVQRRTNVELLRYHWPVLFEVPFSSRTKFALTIVKPNHTEGYGLERKILVKGAPEVLLAKCSSYLSEGRKEAMTEEYSALAARAADAYASAGERVLGFAYLDLETKDYGPEKDAEYSLDPLNFPLEGYTFVGLMSLSDPPKLSVAKAVTTSRKAGIRVFMVTGDHPLTAAAIGRQVGILTTESLFQIPALLQLPLEGEQKVETKRNKIQDRSLVLTGRQLEELSEESWNRILSYQEIVFSRVTPQQKLEIVTQLQRLEDVVAVTGDGVNDAPALKKADIGITMGISGSDASRDAADVILMDDDFSSLVRGIQEGRTIFDNLQKSIASTLTQTVPEMVPVLLDLAFFFPLAITPLLIICIDLGTELFATVALAYEPAESDVMTRPPRKAKRDRLVSRQLLFYVFCQGGLLLTSLAFLAFHFSFLEFGINTNDLFLSDSFSPPMPDFLYKGRLYTSHEQQEILKVCQTVYWIMLPGTQIFHIFMYKTKITSIFKHGMFNNPTLLWGVLVSTCIMILVVYVPTSHIIFGTAIFAPKMWGFVALSWAVMFSYHEFVKFLKRKFSNQGFTKWLMF